MKYTEALSLKVDTVLNSVLFSNRALVDLKLGNNSLSLADSNEALFWDPNNIRALYRKAQAELNLGKFFDSIKDYTTLLSKQPNDSAYITEKINEARKKIEEQKQIITNKNNDDAKLFINSSKLQFEMIQNFINKTEIEYDYEGPHLSKAIDLEWIKENIINKMQKNIYIHKKYLLQLIYSNIQINSKLPSLVEITKEKDIDFTICGDIHGQFYDLLNIFRQNGYPSEKRPYLFTGDFVDRGSFGVEVIITLMFFRMIYPNHFFMSRGNHENRGLNKIYGFENEVREKYDEEVYEAFIELFHSLPLAHVFNNKILALHGGLFSRDDVKLSDIKKIDRFIEIPDTGIMCELLWSDPTRFNGRMPNKRGVAITFGPDVAEKFLNDNGLTYLVRSHEVKHNGYEELGRVITIFSAPNYCDQMGNKGAYLILKGEDMQLEFKQFTEVPHPKTRNYAIPWVFY